MGRYADLVADLDPTAADDATPAAAPAARGRFDDLIADLDTAPAPYDRAAFEAEKAQFGKGASASAKAAEGERQMAADRWDKTPVSATMAAIGQEIGDAAIYHLPGAVAAAVEGGAPSPDREGWTDPLIRRSRGQADARRAERESSGETIMDGVDGLGQSLAFSGVGMVGGAATGIGTGLATTAATANPLAGAVASWTTGTAASGALAYRMATNGFVRDLREAADQESVKRTGQPMSDEDFAAKAADLAPLIREYGLWEAVPEAAGNALGLGILKAGTKDAIGSMFGKNVLTRLTTKMGALYGEELATETVTQQGQHNTEVDAGLGGERRSWASAADLGASFREVAPQTILQTTLLAGGTKAGLALHDRIKRGGLTPEQYDAMMAINDAVDRGQFDPEDARLEAIRVLSPNGVLLVPAPVTARPAPAGVRETAAAQPAQLTEDDHASTIPDDLIDQGQKLLADADASKVANAILKEAGMAPVDSRVTVDYGDGRVASGVVVDAFRETNAELGVSAAGVKIRLDNGRKVEEFFDTLAANGVSVVPEAATDQFADAGKMVPGAAPADDGGTVVAPNQVAAPQESAIPAAPVAAPSSGQQVADAPALRKDEAATLPKPEASERVAPPAAEPVSQADALPLAPGAGPAPARPQPDVSVAAAPGGVPAPELVLRKDGTPFPDQKTARNAAKLRPDLKGRAFDVVKTEGGFALQEKAVAVKERKAATQSGPVDAIRFLAGRGGIRDDEGHDLRKGRNMGRLVPGKGPLLRPTGMGIDAAGETLWNAGYFGPTATTPRPTPQEVLDYLERAVKDKQYSDNDRSEVQAREDDAETASVEAANAAAMAEIDAFLDENELILPQVVKLDALANLGAGMTPFHAVDEAMKSHAIGLAEEYGFYQAFDAAGIIEESGFNEDDYESFRGGEDNAREGQEPAAQGPRQGAASGQESGGDGAAGKGQDLRGVEVGEAIGADQRPDDAKRAGDTKAQQILRLKMAQSKLRKGGQQSVKDQAGGMFSAERDQGDLLAAKSAPKAADAPAAKQERQEFSPEQHVKLVADDVASLRAVDVERLFEQAPRDIDAWDDLRAYIIDRRPDLTAAVMDAIDAVDAPERPSMNDITQEQRAAHIASMREKGERIRAHLVDGGAVVLSTYLKATLYTDPTTLRIGADGVYFQARKKWVFVSDNQLDDMLAQMPKKKQDRQDEADDIGALFDEVMGEERAASVEKARKDLPGLEARVDRLKKRLAKAESLGYDPARARDPDYGPGGQLASGGIESLRSDVRAAQGMAEVTKRVIAAAPAPARPQPDVSVAADAETGTRAPAVTVEDHTDKSIIVRGVGQDEGARFDGMTGKPLWNAKAGGWVFSKKRDAEVRERLGLGETKAPAADSRPPVDRWADEVAAAFKAGGYEASNAKFREIAERENLTRGIQAAFSDKAKAAMTAAGWDGKRPSGPSIEVIAVTDRPKYSGQSGHFAAGRNARLNGAPRQLPSYFTDRNGKNARDWFRGWDAANVEAPVAPPAQGKKLPKRIGTNADGNPVFEDDRGARSYVEGGIRHTETVGVLPNGDVRIDASQRGSEFTTVEEGVQDFIADKRPEPPEMPSAKKPVPPTVTDPETKYVLPGFVAKSAGYGAGNKVFTEDAAAKARALLKAKMGQINSGLDPEIVQAGITLAGYHIEAGARSFAAYTKAMVDDLGEAVRPFLRSWYEGVRYYPGFDATGMTKAAEIDAMGNDAQTEDHATSAAESATMAQEETADDNREDRPEIRGVGAAGVEGPGRGLADGLAGREGTAGLLDSQPAQDDGAADQGGDRGATGARPAKSGGQGGARVSGGRDGADGREGAGGAGLAADGAGNGRGRRQPAGVRPNFHITDPESLIGGSPKVRFARNKAAIEALKAIEEEGRAPTKDELQAMAGYIGWGSFGQELFQGNWDRPYPRSGWEAEDRWLRGHLGKEEWQSAQASIINAHYTDPPTVQVMWEMVKRMGFKGGRVLEPSMGIGNFFGLMPRDLMGKSDLTGIELDKLTGSMARLLYPQANVQIKGYEESQTPDGFYDLVIGNWPFAAQSPADRRYDKLSPTLHDYFFLKALDQTRPGGIVIGVTSAGSMDKSGRSARLEMAKKAELVAVFRLPTGAFEKYAGTKVVTDIIILKKREKPVPVANDGWLNAIEMPTTAGPPITVNEYWKANPGNVLGRMTWGHGTTSGRPGMIVERLPNFAEVLDQLAKRVPAKVMTEVKRGKEPRFVTNNSTDRQGAITVQDGKLYVVQGERLLVLDDVIPHRSKDAKKDKARDDQLAALVEMRRTYGRLIDAERDGAATADTVRADLKRQHDAFVREHGTIKDSDGLSLMYRAEDPFHSVLAALETPDGKPSRILSEATVRSVRRLERPTVRDAFVLTRNESLTVDLDRVAELSNRPKAEIEKELLESKAIYRTPGGGYEVADVYLSGNVRRKLREALDAKEQGEDMDVSIAALREVQPKDVPYFQIEAKLGATWVSPEHYRQFLADLLGIKVGETADMQIRFAAGSWKVRIEDESILRRPEATEGGWGMPRSAYRFDKLLTAAMNNTTITIRTKDSDGNVVVDTSASQEANAKAGRLREEFSSWAWRDAERKIDLEKNYNEVMRAIADPRFDGTFLEFPGMALRRGEDAFSLRKHQVDAIWRGVVNGRGIYAHEVGTGKTYTMGGIAVESRRYGVARKPLILAHNANSATVAREINEMYPGAKVLYVDNLSPDDIDTTLRRIANDDWDAIVVPHSLISRFSMKQETLMALAAEDIAALEEEAIAAAMDDNVTLDVDMMGDDKAMKSVRSVTAKELVKARNRIIETIQKQANRASKEGALPFEDLGIDMIIVDEAHEFKKPPIITKQRMKGLNSSVSDRSIALRFLTGHVKSLNGGKGVHIFTGTPITNTLAEIYNMQRYVMDDQMARDGIKDWDAWFNTFADQNTDVELTDTGEYEPVTRLSQFVNVAELRRTAGQYLDVVFADDMPEFKPRTTASGKTLSSKNLTEAERATLVDGRTENPIGRPYKKVITDVGQMGPQQRMVLEELVELARDWKQAGGKQRREWQLSGDRRMPVQISTAASKAGLDVRLSDMTADDQPDSKVNRAVKNILSVYREHDLATQAVFMEIGSSDTATRTTTDSSGQKTKTRVETFNLVKDMIDKLVSGGIPREQIAVVDGSTSKEKRKATADAMNTGKIRVVIGKTSTLGIGVNMQRNLRAMHHMDAPWMPGDLEQRNGRGHRQGNQWNTVLEYRYITEGLDGKRWQVLAVKSRFIKAFMHADDDVRIIEGDAVDMDEDTSGDSIASTLAEAAGDPRLMLRNKLQGDVVKLENRERMHTYGVADAKQKVRDLQKTVEQRETLAERMAPDVAAVEALTESKSFAATVGGKAYKERKGVDDAIAAIVTKIDKGKVVEIGTVNGATVTANAKEVRFAFDGTGAWEPRYFITIKSGLQYDVNKPTLASIEATIRGIPAKAADLAAKAEDERASMARLAAMGELPFAQATGLENKRKLLADLESDLQKNPVPPPSWLRHGTPINTLVYVDGEPRQVEGHKWTGANWFVVTAEGDVPYLDARDENGSAVYEPRPFQQPPQVKKRTEADLPSGFTVDDAKDANDGKWHIMSPGGFSAASGDSKEAALWTFFNDPQWAAIIKKSDDRKAGTGEKLRILTADTARGLDALEADLPARLAQLGLSDKVSLRLVNTVRSVVTGKAYPGAGGLYYDRVIQVAVDSDVPLLTLNHEAIHALRDMNVLRGLDWKALEKAAAADTELMARVRRDWAEYNLGQDAILEEAVAEMFATWATGRAPTGMAGRAYERVVSFFKALRAALKSAGLLDAIRAGAMAARATGVMQDVDRGRLRGEDGKFLSELTSVIATEKLQARRREPGADVHPAVAFDNEETEARFADAKKGMESPTAWYANAKDWLQTLADGFTRHYIALPNTARFANAKEQLRKLEAAPQSSKETVIRALRDITTGMSRADLDLFTRKIVLDDLTWEAEQGHALPFAFTPDDLDRELAKVDAALETMPDLAAKLRARKLLSKRVSDMLVESGVLSREQVRNPAYFRHQVLEYARAQESAAKGTGKKLKTPYWAKREGSLKDINANYLEAEFDWLHKALVDVAAAKTIAWIKGSNHNIRGQVIAAAKASNREQVAMVLQRDLDANGYADDKGRMTSPLNEAWMEYRKAIAIGMGKVAKAVDPAKVPAQYRDAAEAIAERASRKKGDVATLADETAEDAEIFPFLAWMMDNDQPGAMGAGMVFKAISQRREWVRETLGKRYADPMDLDGLVKRGLAPAGYVTWQPDSPDGRGKVFQFFTARTLPEQVIDKLLAKLAANTAGTAAAFESLRPALQANIKESMAVGGLKYQMVIPEELAATLNSLRDENTENLLLHLTENVLNKWKQWTLISPRRWAGYNINNTSGDLDALIAGNHRALARVPEAVRELWAVMKKGERPSARYAGAVERGVFDSGLSIQEIPEINTLSEFEALTKPTNWDSPASVTKAGMRKGWRFLQKSTQFRENIFRYAAYLDYLERIERGDSMRTIGYGASKREIVDAVTDTSDRAALLARELIGDYGNISHWGRGIRRHIAPFYSWMEINTKRYWRLTGNAFGEGIGRGLATGGALGAMAGARTTAALALRMVLLYGLVQLWNNLFFGDDEDELEVADRAQLHLLFGRDADNQIRMVRFQGALTDFLNWVGYADVAEAYSKIESGRAGWDDVVKAVPKGAVNKVAQSIRPEVKLAMEGAAGQSYFPDMFQPRPLRDGWRNLFSTLGVAPEYDAIMDKPSRGYWKSWTSGTLKHRDAGEMAYNRVRGMVYDWKREVKGEEGAGAAETARSRALYEWKQALKFGDESAAAKARETLRELKVTGSDLVASVKRAHPLAPIALKDRPAFLRTLSDRDRQALTQATDWYRETYVRR